MNRHAGYFSLVICRGSIAIFEYADYVVPVCLPAVVDRDNEKWGLSRRQLVLRVGELDGHQGSGELVELMTSLIATLLPWGEMLTNQR